MGKFDDVCLMTEISNEVIYGSVMAWRIGQWVEVTPYTMRMIMGA